MNTGRRNILVGAGIATVGAIGTKTAVDYFKNLNKEQPVDESLASTPFVVEVNGQKLASGQGKTKGTNEVDFVLANA